jgi:tRNA pseudouridine(38-40) synthase
LNEIEHSNIFPFTPKIHCSGDKYEMCVITVKGMAFLWHQVRCMVAILFLIGENLEEPEVGYKIISSKFVTAQCW